MSSKVKSKYKAKYEVESRFSRPIIKQNKDRKNKKLLKGLKILVPSGSDNNHRGKAIENAQKQISLDSFITSDFKRNERMRKGQPLTINASEMEGIWPTSKEDDANRHKKFEPRERQYQKNAMNAVKENVSIQLSEMSVEPPRIKRLEGFKKLNLEGRKKHKKRRIKSKRRKIKRRKSKRRKSKRRKSIKRRRKSRRK